MTAIPHAHAHAANRLLARTINIPLDIGNDPDHVWTLDGDDDKSLRRALDLCRDAGFTAIRLMLGWSAVAEPGPPFTIRPTALERVDRAVDLATDRGLAVIIQAVLDDGILADPPVHRDRLLAITRQVAEHFAERPTTVLLEPAAEPRGALDAVWNEYLADLVAAVRQSNPDRTLIFGPGAYNNVRAMGSLVLPEDDDNIITTFHQYWPEFPPVVRRGVGAGRGLIMVVAGSLVWSSPVWRLWSVWSAGPCARVSAAGRGWPGVWEACHGAWAVRRVARATRPRTRRG